MKTLRPDAERIKALRIQKTWPQEQLAQVAEVSPRTIQRIEGGGNASYETLRSIASAFDVETEELLMARADILQSASPPDNGEQAAPPITTSVSDSVRMLSIRNRRLEIISGLLAFALLVTFGFVGVARFWQRPPVSGKTALEPNITGETTPIARTQTQLETATRTPEVRKAAREIKQPAREVLTPESMTQRSAPTQEASSDNETAFAPVLPELSLDLRQTSSTALEPMRAAIPSDLIFGPGDLKADGSTNQGLSSRVREVAVSAYLSTGDTARQSSKQLGGFFMRLGTSMKKAF